MLRAPLAAAVCLLGVCVGPPPCARYAHLAGRWWCGSTGCQAGNLPAWTAYVRHVVDTFARYRRVVAMTITNEVNVTFSPNTYSGTFGITDYRWFNLRGSGSPTYRGEIAALGR